MKLKLQVHLLEMRSFWLV